MSLPVRVRRRAPAPADPFSPQALCDPARLAPGSPRKDEKYPNGSLLTGPLGSPTYGRIIRETGKKQHALIWDKRVGRYIYGGRFGSNYDAHMAIIDWHNRQRGIKTP